MILKGVLRKHEHPFMSERVQILDLRFAKEIYKQEMCRELEQKLARKADAGGGS